MSRASISTGNISFTLSSETSSPSRSSTNNQLKIMIMGDFSGRGSRGICAPEDLATRKVRKINIDNFDDVLYDMGVQLQLSVTQKPVLFTELDDFEPDYVYESVPLFSNLRQIKRQLAKNDTIDKAVEQMRQWGLLDTEDASAPAESAETKTANLDDILSATPSSSNDEDHIARYIRNIVAPTLKNQVDPRQAQYTHIVDLATAELMRQLLHCPQYQAVECRWRALFWLVRRLAASSKVSVSILDVTHDEIREDIRQAGSLIKSGIHQNLGRAANTPSDGGYPLILGDFKIGANVDDVVFANDIASIAHDLGATWVMAGDEKFAGAQSITDEPDHHQWTHTLDDDVANLWGDLRTSVQSQHLALTVPRFLTRLPYGRQTDPIESFPFEELQQTKVGLAWANGAYLLLMVLVQSHPSVGSSFQTEGAGYLDDMLLHSFNGKDGTVVVPPTEKVLTMSALKALAEAGLTPIGSIKNQLRVFVPYLQGVNRSGKLNKAPQSVS